MLSPRGGDDHSQGIALSVDLSLCWNRDAHDLVPRRSRRATGQTRPASAKFVPRTVRDQPAAEFDPDAACEQVVRAHNRLRAEHKLPSLAISDKLTAAAERHAKDMAAHEKMAHKGSDGSSPIDRIKATGYDYRRAGENIAASRFNTERLMKGWVDSPHHKKNILGSFSQIGVACATGESGKRYWCVTFGLPTRR